MNLGRLANLWSYSARSSVKHWRQSLAVLIPIAVAMSVAASMTFVRDGLSRDAKLSSAFLPDLTVQFMSAGRATHVPADVAESIAGMSHVRRVVPRIWGFLPMHVDGRDVAYSLLGIDVAHMPIPKDIGLGLKAGRFLKPGERGCVLLGESAARVLGASAGDAVEMMSPGGAVCRFKVVGVFTSAVQIYTADLLVTGIEDARDFFGYGPHEASDLCVYVDGEQDVDSVAASIAKSVPGSRVLSRDKLTRIADQAFGTRSGVFQIVWMILLLTVALTTWSQASSTTLQMRKEIGILKAVGWSTMDVIQARMFSTAIVSLLGCMIGQCAGLLYLVLGAPGIKEYFLGWAAVYPEFAIPVSIRPESLVMLVAVSTVPILAAVILPAWLSGITEPDSAVRGG